MDKFILISLMLSLYIYFGLMMKRYKKWNLKNTFKTIGFYGRQ